MRHRKPQAVILLAVVTTILLVSNRPKQDVVKAAETDISASKDTVQSTQFDMESARPETGQGQE